MRLTPIPYTPLQKKSPDSFSESEDDVTNNMCGLRSIRWTYENGPLTPSPSNHPKGIQNYLLLRPIRTTPKTSIIIIFNVKGVLLNGIILNLF